MEWGTVTMTLASKGIGMHGSRQGHGRMWMRVEVYERRDACMAGTVGTTACVNVYVREATWEPCDNVSASVVLKMISEPSSNFKSMQAVRHANDGGEDDVSSHESDANVVECPQVQQQARS